MSPDTSLNIAGLVLGVMGVLGTLQTLFAFVRYYLPKHRLDSLEKSYTRAYSLLQCGISEGVLLPNEAGGIRQDLECIRTRMNDVHDEVICLRNVWQQLAAIFQTVSRTLSQLEKRVQTICIELSSSSREGRLRLQKNGFSYRPCLMPMGNITDTIYPLQMAHTMSSNSVLDDPPSFNDPGSLHAHHSLADRDGKPQPPSCSYSAKSPHHRDSVSSVLTTTTVVEDDDIQISRLDKGNAMADPGADTITPHGNVDSRDIAIPISAFHMPPVGRPTFVSEPDVDSESTIQECRLKFQLQISSIQSLLSLVNSDNTLPNAPSEVIEGLQEVLMTSQTLVSSLSHLWSRSETGPLLPS